jgi:hypothetical protein
MNFIEKKRFEVEERAEKFSQHTNNILAIKKFMESRFEEIKLNSTQKEMMLRYQYYYNQMSTGKYNDRALISQIISHFNVSKSQAEIDVRISKELYGTTFQINKQFQIANDLAILNTCREKAIATGQLDVAAKLLKVKAEFLKMVPDEKDNNDDYSPATIITMFNPALIGVEPLDKSKVTELMATLKKEYGYDGNLDFIESIDFTEDAEDTDNQ